MSETRIAQYEMNPAEDEILFGDELADGMRVLAENPSFRSQPHGDTEAARARAGQFRRVLRPRVEAATEKLPSMVSFVGEWDDGYSTVHSYGVAIGWIVKRDTEATP